METKNDNHFKAILLIIVIIILIGWRILFIADKEEEKASLLNLKNSLIKKKDWMEYLKIDNERKSIIGYFIFKMIVLGVLICICYFTIEFTNSSCTMDAITNCTKIFNAMGIGILLICFLFEQNPFDVFRAREFVKTFIKNLVAIPNAKEIEDYPIVLEQIESTTKKIDDIDEILSAI
jgi:lipid-A-disaccharide synthase-like uncharacterized protein